MSGHEQTFLADVLSDARRASKATRVPTSVILAQWANETGWGTSSAWREGHNYAGVSPGGRVARYPDRETGLAAYVRTMLLPYYEPVRRAGDPWDAAEALAESPWAAGHYNGGRGLTSIMREWELTRYDDPNATATAPPVDPDRGSTIDPSGVVPAIDLNPFDNMLAGVGRIVMTGLFVAGGLTLIALGAWRAVANRRGGDT